MNGSKEVSGGSCVDGEQDASGQTSEEAKDYLADVVGCQSCSNEPDDMEASRDDINWVSADSL